VAGFGGGRPADLPTNHALVKTYSVLGLNLGGYRLRAPDALAEAHADLMALYARGSVEPLVSEVLTLEQVPDGLRRLHAGSTVGKLVVALTS
jgi:NADPH:quinone reductase